MPLAGLVYFQFKFETRTKNWTIPNLMGILHFVIIIVNIHGYWFRKAHISRKSEEPQVKVTKGSLGAKKD